MKIEEGYYHKRLYNYLRLIGSKSVDTLTLYRNTLNVILAKFTDPDKATLDKIQAFALEFENDNTRRNVCVVLRWLFNKVLNRNIEWYELPYPRRTRKVQPIYTHEEAMKILSHITNEKQKAILALTIDQGLRINEPCHILLSDCSIDEQKIILRSAKGGIDRIIYPSMYVWGLLESYLNVWHTTPNKYLFEGAIEGNPYTASSIRAFVRRHCELTGVEYKKVHAFRRYSITWSHENGAELPALAQRSGHKSTRTIENHYLIHSPSHLRKVPSPLQTFAA